MKVTVNVGGLIQFLLLGEVPGGDDKANVIGLSTVAYLSAKDPAHVLLPAAEWHDGAYLKGSSIQATWPRWKVDLHFYNMMVEICHWPTLSKTPEERLLLEKEAWTLYLWVREYGQAAWEGTVPENEGPV
jgi:hypothetical protein